MSDLPRYLSMDVPGHSAPGKRRAASHEGDLVHNFTAFISTVLRTVTSFDMLMSRQRHEGPLTVVTSPPACPGIDLRLCDTILWPEPGEGLVMI